MARRRNARRSQGGAALAWLCSVRGDDAPARTRIAYAFVGHARTFEKAAVHKSIQAQLLNSFGAGCDNDVFWYFAEDPIWPASTRERLYSIFQPVAVSIDGGEDSSAEWFEPCREPPAPRMSDFGVRKEYKFFAEPANAVRIARAQFRKFHKAFELVEARERKTGWKYDWVVRCRFDAGWYASMPHFDTFPTDAIYVSSDTWNGISDQFAIVPRKLANDYFRGTDEAMSQCDATGLPKWYAGAESVWQPETFLHSLLNRAGVPFRRCTVPAVVDYGSTSRCLAVCPYSLLGLVVDARTFASGLKAEPFARLAKTAHVAACAARFPCCKIEVYVGDRTVTVDAGPHDAVSGYASLCRHYQLSGAECAQLFHGVRNAGSLADDASVSDDLRAIDTALASLSEDTVVVQINSHTTRVENGPAAAAADAMWAGRVSVDGAAARALWEALRCQFFELWPRALALGAPSNDADCLGATDRLDYAERSLHAFVDDGKLTHSTYDSIVSTNLGFQVWNVPGAAPMPDMLRPDGVRGPTEPS
ncbi:hypothetical protein M885DRAFT_613690 [Pelagophyceae sp. CCMP2097]|nr:hypothetical protein M885DRAFT_613690 [Pelagophyceae sp. CCMP2097]|mmetsp:Transcript_1001/g.3615  ORF Transcript_1001/g.3615 Transcript_1001/m.3615 type:complete len:533 (-) Transcript_1001:29-1627(-)